MNTNEFIKRYSSMVNEESPKDIKTKHPGILAVPSGKNVEDMPMKHFIELARSKGLKSISNALQNLERWNKKTNPKLSKWAGDMRDRVAEKLKKEQENEYQ